MCLVELYKKFNIVWDTDVSDMRNDEFPTIGDLYSLVEEKTTSDSTNAQYYEAIKTYLKSAADGADHGLEEASLLLVRRGRGFPGGAGHDELVVAEVHEVLRGGFQGGVVYAAGGVEGGDHRGADTFENRILHTAVPFRPAIPGPQRFSSCPDGTGYAVRSQ